MLLLLVSCASFIVVVAIFYSGNWRLIGAVYSGDAMIE